MGVIVLQTSIEDKTPEEIYTLFKERWTIETFYNYFKNKAGYAAIHKEVADVSLKDTSKFMSLVS